MTDALSAKAVGPGVPVPTTIVLDTNVFYGDVLATGRLLGAVIEGAAAGDFRVVVPETVVMELARQYPERLDKAIAAADRAVRSFAKEARQLGIDPLPGLSIERDRLVAAYERMLRDRLSGRGSSIAPHPEALQRAVEWAVSRRKPFKLDGQGLPDAAIWLTVLDEAARSAQVLFVTENASDFSDGDGSHLAGELVDDLLRAHIPVGRIRLIPKLADLVEAVVRPMADADARASRLMADPPALERLLEATASELRYAVVPQWQLNLPIELDDDPQAVDIRFDPPKLERAHGLPEQRLMLELTLFADADVEGIASGEEAAEAADDDRIQVVREDDDGSVVRLPVEVITRIRVVTDLQANEVRVEEVEWLEGLDEDGMAERRLASAARGDLADQIAHVIDSERLAVAGYIPPAGIEADVAAVAVRTRRLDDPILLEVLDFDDDTAHCRVEFTGAADVEWLVSSPTPADLTMYSHLVEGDPSEGGPIHDQEADEPISVEADVVLWPHGYPSEVQQVQIRLDSASPRAHLAAGRWSDGEDSPDDPGPTLDEVTDDL